MTNLDETNEYVLGTEEAETERLRFQHAVWREQAYALWARAGFRGGDSLLDLGCGPGFTSLDLAGFVGATGKVLAVDQSGRFLATLRQEAARQGAAHLETLESSIEALDVPPGSVDGAYARWLFCWLPDPALAVERVARALAPGGAIVIQDYIDWAAMDLLPPSPIFHRSIEACMASWRASGGDIDVGKRLPAIAQELGLVVEHYAPVARVGAVGSLEWRWMRSFYESYLSKLVERGELDGAHLAEHLALWAERDAAGDSWCYTPTMVDIVLRKPGVGI